MAIMKIGSLSGFVKPIQNKWIELDLILGITYGKAKNSSFKSFDYIYDIEEKKITFLTRDYQLIVKDHFGYQVGFNLSFYPFRKIGLQISTRIQDLSNGGTFFLVGGGVVFKM